MAVLTVQTAARGYYVYKDTWTPGFSLYRRSLLGNVGDLALAAFKKSVSFLFGVGGSMLSSLLMQTILSLLFEK